MAQLEPEGIRYDQLRNDIDGYLSQILGKENNNTDYFAGPRLWHNIFNYYKRNNLKQLIPDLLVRFMLKIITSIHYSHPTEVATINWSTNVSFLTRKKKRIRQLSPTLETKKKKFNRTIVQNYIYSIKKRGLDKCFVGLWR